MTYKINEHLLYNQTALSGTYFRIYILYYQLPEQNVS